MVGPTYLTKMYSFLDEYLNLPLAFRDQLDHIWKLSKEHNSLNQNILRDLKKFNKQDRKRILKIMFFRETSASDILTSLNKWTEPEDFICYNTFGKWIGFHKVIASGRNVILFEGKRKRVGDDLVIKWYQSEKKDTNYEVSIYEKLQSMNAKLPFFISGYYFWETPVLVLEKLDPVDTKADEIEMGIQILDQLKTVHKLCIHNDIKPGNIMRKGNIYYLIDYGGVTTERLGWGFRRRVWSPKWTCQKIHEPNQVTGPKHDFIELGYTMQYLSDSRAGIKFKRGRYSGKIRNYMEEVKKITSNNVKKEDYDRLISILK